MFNSVPFVILPCARRHSIAVKIKTGVCLAFALMIFAPVPSLGQQAILLPCKDQLAAWQADLSLKDKIKGWYCPNPNARTMPIPPTGGQPSTGGGFPMGLPTTDAQAKVAIMGWLIQGLMSSDSSADTQQQQALLQQKQAEEKFKEEMLQKERAFQAREARVLWERQDADRDQVLGSLFGPSTEQTGGLSPLLQKQAALTVAAPSNSASDEDLRHRAEGELPGIQPESLAFLGKSSGDKTPDSGIYPQDMKQIRVPVPPSFPVSATDTITRESQPVIEFSAETYRIIGFVGKSIKEAPLKFGEIVISALGFDNHLGILKLAKGLSDEAGRSMQNAVEIIGKGYPENETVRLIKGSESRAMKIFVDSFSDIPTPFSEEEKNELEINGRKWFNWLTVPRGEARQ